MTKRERNQILAEAADIMRRTGLVKGMMARDAQGNLVDPASRSAVCFCAIGVLHLVKNSRVEDEYPPRLAVLSVLAGRGLKVNGLAAWNDKYAKSAEDVALLFEEAMNVPMVDE